MYIPNKLSKDKVKEALKNKLANRHNAIKETLKQLGLKATKENVARAEKVVDFKVQEGLLTADYTEPNEQRINLLETIKDNILGNTAGISFIDFLKSVIEESDEDNVVIATNQGIVILSPEDIRDSITDYVMVTNQPLPTYILDIAQKTTSFFKIKELNSTQKEQLITYLQADMNFLDFCVRKKLKELEE